jgi:hypothetical protein
MSGPKSDCQRILSILSTLIMAALEALNGQIEVLEHDYRFNIVVESSYRGLARGRFCGSRDLEPGEKYEKRPRR